MLRREFGEDVEKMLELTTANSVNRKNEAMTTIIYSMGLDRFGVEEDEKSGGT